MSCLKKTLTPTMVLVKLNRTKYKIEVDGTKEAAAIEATWQFWPNLLVNWVLSAIFNFSL